MIDKARIHSALQTASRWSGTARERVAPYLEPGNAWRAAFIAIALAVLYWGLVASDRYVSEAHVVIDRTDLAPAASMDLAAVLTGHNDTRDELLMRDHLLSVDMLKKLDAKLNLRAHYSDSSYDILSRLWSAQGPEEWFYQHYVSRVSVELDEQSGVLIIKAQAYTPEMAHSIATMLVGEGERYMNEMAHKLARDQVGFLENQLISMNERVQSTRQAVISYQNQHSLVSPEGTIASVSAVVAKLEGQLAELKAKREAMLGYLSPNAPDIAQLNIQIAAIERQITYEQERLASPKGKALNSTVEKFQRLQLEAGLAQDVYRTALVALEKVRVEAVRTLKKVSVLQAPTLPQYSLEPRRLYNIVTFSVVALVLAAILNLLAAIIRDHKD